MWWLRSDRTEPGRLSPAAGCAVALALVLLPASPPAEGAQEGEASYGLVAMGANGVPGETLADRVANYRRLREAGVEAVRVDINWHQVEPAGEPLHDYDFSERDREITAIRRAGLEVIGILAYGHADYAASSSTVGQTPLGGEGIPPFALGASRSYPPDDPADFAAYAQATASHYGDEVMAWEVWNEENQGYRFWAPREDPAAYARLLCATHPVLKDVDPETPVVFGGVFFAAVAGQPGTSGPDFVQAAYGAEPGLGRCYDVMAYHPYAYPFTAPELDVPIRGSVLSAADTMRAVLERNGDAAKPLWITEVGWPTHDRSYGVPERKQAQYVARMQAATFAQGIPVLGWYTYGDAKDPSGGFNQESWFGFFRPDGSAKPAYEALRTFSRVFRGMRFRRDLSGPLGLPPGEQNMGGRGFALRFGGRDRAGAKTNVTAVWLATESATDGQNSMSGDASGGTSSVPVRLPVRGAGARIFSHLGERTRAPADGGTLALDAGPGPVYVVDRAKPRS